MNRLAASAFCALSALVFLAGKQANADARVVDATGQTVLVGEASRIVSVGGAVTEIVFALGLSDRVVAVDSTSRYPDEAAAKPDVGYMRRLGAEPILALEPTLVLAVEDAGPPDALEQLREAGVPVVLVPDESSPAGVMEKIAVVAKALDAREEGRVLETRFEAEMREASALVDTMTVRPRVLFLLSIGSGGAPLAAGRNTSAAGIIELAGGINAIDEFEGYRPLSPEAAVDAAPEVILVTDRSLRLLGGERELLAIPEIALTPAGQHERIVALDGLLLLGFGPRTATAVAELARRLHPALGRRSAADGR